MTKEIQKYSIPFDKGMEFFSSTLDIDNRLSRKIYSKSNVLEEDVSSVIYETDAHWHFLCVLTDYNLEKISKSTLSEADITGIVNLSQTLIINAYDGEGYLIWESADSK